MEEKVFKAGILDPEEYVNLGLIDGLRSFDQEISTILFYSEERYSSDKIKEINAPKKNFMQRFS